MGMLSRYNKAGGFLQLLKLIETCEEPKKRSFLKMIESEDANWAKAIETKMLTVDRIFHWEHGVLGKIAGHIPEDVIAALLHKYQEPIYARMLPSFSSIQKERIQEMSIRAVPTEKELTRAIVQFITEVRRILCEGSLSIDKIDPSLSIPLDIEDQLMNGIFQAPLNAAPATEVVAPAPAGPVVKKAPPPAAPAKAMSPQAMEAELIILREKLQAFAYQNNRLRKENQQLREALEARPPYKKTS